MKHVFILALSLLALNVHAQISRLEVLDLRQVPLADAARILSEASGLNVVASVEAGKTLISLYLTNVEPRAAIEALCRSHNLWFRDDEKSSIIRIHTPEEYKRDLGSFQDEQTEVFDLRFPNAADIGRSIKDLYGQRVRMNQSTLQQEYQTTQELQQRFQRFDVVDGRSQHLGFSQTGGSGTSSGGSSSGLGRGSMGGFNSLGSQNQNNSSNSIQAQTQLRPLEGLTADQVQALEASGSVERDAAVQSLLDDRVDIFVTVIQRLNKVVVRTSDARAMEQIKALILSIDVPTQTVLLEVKILSVTLNQGYSSAVEYLFDNGHFQAGFGNNLTTPPVQAGNLSFSFASKNFSARIQVLEQKGQVRTVSTPTLLIANNEVSRLFIGEERPLNRSFNGGTIVPSATNNLVTTGSTNIEFRPVGTTLLITPNINADKTLTLRLLQENSNINVGGASVLVPSSTGFTSQTVDTVQSRTVSGTVVAHDQVPVVIGGLISTNFTDTRAQVPFLGSIPILGTLFGNRQNSKTRDELVLVICPHIIDPKDYSVNISKEMLEANNVQMQQAFISEKEVNDRLQKNLQPPLPPRALPVPEDPPKPKKRTLMDFIRGRK